MDIRFVISELTFWLVLSSSGDYGRQKIGDIAGVFASYRVLDIPILWRLFIARYLHFSLLYSAWSMACPSPPRTKLCVYLQTEYSCDAITAIASGYIETIG